MDKPLNVCVTFVCLFIMSENCECFASKANKRHFFTFSMLLSYDSKARWRGHQELTSDSPAKSM